MVVTRTVALAVRLALAVTLSLAVGRVVTAPAPPPATAHEVGLLAWPPRGDLVRNPGLVAAATRLWRRSPSVGTMCLRNVHSFAATDEGLFWSRDASRYNSAKSRTFGASFGGCAGICARSVAV